AESLELAKKVNAIVLDKTGTITEGKPVVTDILWLNNEESSLPALASIEKASEHPLAEAVVKHLGKTEYLPVNNFESITGFGAKAQVNSQTFYVGNASLLRNNNLSIARELDEAAKKWLAAAKTVIYFANEKQALAVIAIADKVKATSV